ncbi:MAG TPA: aminotransferase class V-fold PLP-dependent enzyme, partial [Geobacteraceae bacterium]
ERIAAAMRPATRLVALAHCSNVTGTIQPVAQIGALVKESGAFFLVDAAQSAGSLAIDVGTLGIHLLAVPGHKGLFGPQGTGFLYMAEGVELTPLIVGGTGGASGSLEQPEGLPDRFESGTLNTPGIAGLKAGVEFILATGVDAIREKEARSTTLVLAGLRDIPGVTIHGPSEHAERGAVISFTVAGHDAAEIGFMLDRDHDISVRVGLHCAVSAHKTIGSYPAGTVRVSPGYFTTDEDVSVFVQALRALVVR